MEEQQILDKMHSLHLILADEVKRICEKHNIKYFMLAGTMLGAIRHKGFIPWDDDMDFGMLREDFEKFLIVCESEMNREKFYLQTDRKDTLYPFNFAKLKLVGTKVIEEFSQSSDLDQGIYIDIFPIDYISDNALERFFQLKFFWIIRNILWIKCGYGDEERKSQLIYKIIKRISKIIPIAVLKKSKHKIISKYSKKRTCYVITSDGNYGLKKETLKTEWVDNICEYAFEDKMYPGIKAYEEYLSYFYGDYMIVPEINKRNHHARLNVDFGEYNN